MNLREQLRRVEAVAAARERRDAPLPKDLVRALYALTAVEMDLTTQSPTECLDGRNRLLARAERLRKAVDTGDTSGLQPGDLLIGPRGLAFARETGRLEASRLPWG